MDGLKEKIMDDKERYKIIVEKLLYWSDINPTNIFICKLLIDPYGEYKLKYNEGDTLKLDITKKWNIRNFDAVIGNPPYNKNLYKKFTEYLLEKCNNLLFVIPSTCTISITGKEFINKLKEFGLKYLVFVNKNIWIIHIDIDTMYILCTKKYNGNIIINNINVERNLNIRNYTNKCEYNIIKKIDIHEKLKLCKGLNKTLNYKNKIETDNIKFNKTEEHCHKLLSRLNGGRGEEIYYINEYIEEDDCVKLLFPRGTASYNSHSNLIKINKDIVYSKICDEKILLSTGIVYIKCKNIKEAEILQWYLMRSKIVRYLFIKENKFSELTKGFINLIPKINYKLIDKMIDEYVYKYFNLTNDEISTIEKYFE
jgi:hypothetical protein